MKLKEEEVIAFLSKEYAGPVAARGLWTWAGGDVSDMAFPKPAQEQWKKLWELDGEDSPPSRIALLREALLDHIGDGTVLEFLDAISDDEFPEGRPAAAILFSLLDKVSPPFDSEDVFVAMTSFPLGLAELPEDEEAPSEEKMTDTIFAAIVSSFQGKYSQDDRTAIEEKCRSMIEESQPVSIKMLVDGMFMLLKNLPEMTHLPDKPEVEEPLKELQKAVKPLPETKKEEVPESLEQVSKLLEQIESQAKEAEDDQFKAVCVSLAYQFKCISLLFEEKNVNSFQYLAKAMIPSLWGTLGT